MQFNPCHFISLPNMTLILCLISRLTKSWLAHTGKARGCFTNTYVVDSLVQHFVYTVEINVFLKALFHTVWKLFQNFGKLFQIRWNFSRLSKIIWCVWKLFFRTEKNPIVWKVFQNSWKFFKVKWKYSRLSKIIKCV